MNSFRRNVTGIADPFTSSGQSPVGRDPGVQLRVLPVNGHIDFRVGAFQGHRSALFRSPPYGRRGRRPQRAPGGAAANQPARRGAGILLPGHPSRAKKILSIGGFDDFQDKYEYYFGGDFLVDLPMGPGIVTPQADVVQWDGGSFITLRKATVFMGETAT